MRTFVLLLPFVVGCKFMSALDFGGIEKEPFEIRAGWDHGIHQAAADTKPGQTDAGGVYKPETPAADALLAFPNVHAGLCIEVKPAMHVTPIIAIEALSAKAPYIGWWEVQVGAGANIAEVYLGKRLLSVWEITVGPCFLRDIDRHEWGFGGLGTVIKF